MRQALVERRADQNQLFFRQRRQQVPHRLLSLRGGNRFDTAVGPVSFDAKGDLTNPTIAWFKWVDGRYVEVDPKTLEPPILNTTP